MAADIVAATAFFPADLVRRRRFRASWVQCWYVTAGGTGGTTGEMAGGPTDGTSVGTGEEWPPSEVDQWELAELEPQLELWLLLGMEPPSEMREA